MARPRAVRHVAALLRTHIHTGHGGYEVPHPTLGPFIRGPNDRLKKTDDRCRPVARSGCPDAAEIEQAVPVGNYGRAQTGELKAEHNPT